MDTGNKYIHFFALTYWGSESR